MKRRYIVFDSRVEVLKISSTKQGAMSYYEDLPECIREGAFVCRGEKPETLPTCKPWRVVERLKRVYPEKGRKTKR
jgi:hypothetical protein